MSLSRPDSDILPRLSTAGAREPRPSAIAEEVVALFDQTRTPLLRYLLSFGLPVADGEEILQEVFLALLRHLERGKPRHNLRSWLFRVAHNLGLKRRETNHRILKILANADECPVETVVDVAPDPEQQITSMQRRQRILAIMNALPEQDRRCLYLRIEGLRYREIAQILGISLAAVALAMARSLARLSSVDGR